ncbi:MAG: hypothetical protein HY225_01805 [Candidatus Vogelbacteria bacterium]|nr:hypothetical protein [Candidatus Vogelbacteria bacterium]
MNKEQNGNIGAMIASMIIVILLITGGYFAWQNRSAIQAQNTNIPDGSSIQPTEAIAPPTTPPQESTEISDIAADAAAVDLKPLDTGLENLDLLVK